MRHLLIAFLCIVAGGVYFYNTNWFQASFMSERFHRDIFNAPFDATKTGETITIPIKYTYSTCYGLAIAVPDSKLAHRGFEGDGFWAYRFMSGSKILAEGLTTQPDQRHRALYRGVTYITLLVFDLPFPDAGNDLTLELTVKKPMEFLARYKGVLTCRIRPNYSAKAGGCYDEELRLGSM
ncbi:hypothetical protein [Pseudodesulfovibrio sp.]|uniref:hypothetical protein n=1 Tax=Pseudodesulfovibrio sp. TaxID=2035812 RepID=UPI0026270E18|nr:hypothetical protein [Pseudodesulfovibrio sp.]MDD3313684.1 hypothetical protein [Pseudodesulfovibrio sp.]